MPISKTIPKKTPPSLRRNFDSSCANERGDFRSDFSSLALATLADKLPVNVLFRRNVAFEGASTVSRFIAAPELFCLRLGKSVVFLRENNDIILMFIVADECYFLTVATDKINAAISLAAWGRASV